MIEQAKFTYSSLGTNKQTKIIKKKQTKTIKDQGEKQADALKALKPKETKPVEYDNYFIKGLVEIRDSTKTIDFNNLTYNFKDPNIAPINFIGFKGPLHILFLKLYMMAINL